MCLGTPQVSPKPACDILYSLHYSYHNHNIFLMSFLSIAIVV